MLKELNRQKNTKFFFPRDKGQMSKLVQLLQCDGVRNALLRYLDMRSWIVLRATARSLRNFFSLDMLSAVVRLPKPEKGSFVDQYHKYLWFFGLPNFSDDISRFPKQRVDKAVARLAQGVLRKLSMIRVDDHLYLLGTVQPAMAWKAAHFVFFSFSRLELSYCWCHCRNGYGWLCSLLL